ncbi:ACT domain-containing protein [Actinoallomurus soli]|uniref:amino acid-binding protein n=1 Tax=Actinoallomurus soli TaxID=2952535 RepID=UPI002093CC9D|nr:amino acid-binding protein [Actinoallomurus soli]MCO5970715.1 amino acid-binding protein [Actinoallomurus soli]
MPLLRIRLRLPDRPGSLGTVARTLGAAGADIVQVVVLERSGGRAVDDITVSWSQGVSLDVLCDALVSVRGVEVDGVWRTHEAPGVFSDVEVVGQIAANPPNGVVALVEAVPKIFGGDWAAMLGRDGIVVHASWQAPDPLTLPVIPASGARAFTGEDGIRYASVPVGRSRQTLLLARVAAPPFHRTELERLIQLATAAEAVLGVGTSV